MITKNDLEIQAQFFKALGHPARLAMVHYLADGPRCVCELQNLIELDVSTVSKHLSVLKVAGIVSTQKRGNNVFYALCKPCILEMLACLQSSGTCTCSQ